MSIKKGGIKTFKIILGFNTLDFSQQVKYCRLRMTSKNFKNKCQAPIDQ